MQRAHLLLAWGRCAAIEGILESSAQIPGHAAKSAPDLTLRAGGKAPRGLELPALREDPKGVAALPTCFLPSCCGYPGGGCEGSLRDTSLGALGKGEALSALSWLWSQSRVDAGWGRFHARTPSFLPPQALDSELLNPRACPWLLFFFSLPLKNIE